MGAFEYVAVDAAGRERKGVAEGDTPRQVRQLLREQGLLPVAVDEVVEQKQQDGRTARVGWRLQRGLSASDLALVTRQLATLVKSGLPLEEALLAVSQQTDKPRVRSIILGVRSKVMEGHTLADGLSDFPARSPRSTAPPSPRASSPATSTRCSSGSPTTRQPPAAAQPHPERHALPVMLFVVCVAIVFFLLVSVVPKVVEVFRTSDAELPLLTQLLISGSDFMRQYGVWLAIVVAGAIFLFTRWLRVEANRRRWHQFLLRLPLVGKVVRGSNTARFAAR